MALTTFLLMVGASIKNNLLDQMFYIYYLIYFKENKIQALINLNYKVNVMILRYTLKLSLKIHSINVEAQKINSFIFKIFKIVLSSF